MTVPKSQRGQSRMEFFYRALKLNDAITQVLLRDFGIKRTLRELKTFTYCAKMEPKDQEAFIDLCGKYGIDTEARYPLWLVEYYRDWILALLREMINNITQANTIYPTSENEFYFRRQYQWKAIGCCYQLLQAMQTAIRNLPVDVEKYMRFVGMIEEELELLKGWKKSDNKILKAIQQKNGAKN